MKTIAAHITLFRPEEGGRERPISAVRDFSCPVYFQDIPELGRHAYDCRLLLRGRGKEIAPGESADDVEIAFLSPDDVLPHIRVGSRFELWESKIIGTATVTHMPRQPFGCR